MAVPGGQRPSSASFHPLRRSLKPDGRPSGSARLQTMPLRRSRSFSDEFAILDADRSGTVTKDELISALRQRLPGVTADEADSGLRG